MNAQQQELFDAAILRVLDANHTRFGLGLTAVVMLIGQYGFHPNNTDVERRLDYMEDKEINFIEQVNKGQFNTANRAWKITAKGTNWLRERGY